MVGPAPGAHVLRFVFAAAIMLSAPDAPASGNVTLVGLMGQRAVVSIDGRITRTLSVGQRAPEGVRLLAVVGGTAQLEIADTVQTLSVGQQSAGRRGGEVVVLHPDGRGHYLATGSINGALASFVVDTGATVIAIGARDARRIGIVVGNAPRVSAQTAAGVIQVQRVKLDSVRVGAIELKDVDAVVHENDLPVILLGMSFLSRMDMQREGETLTLKKRY